MIKPSAHLLIFRVALLMGHTKLKTRASTGCSWLANPPTGKRQTLGAASHWYARKTRTNRYES